MLSGIAIDVRDQIVHQYMGLATRKAISLYRRYPEVERADLAQEARLALVEAATVFMVKSGEISNAVGYFTHVIRNKMMDYLNAEGVVTMQRRRTYPQLVPMRNDDLERLGGVYTVEDLLSHPGVIN